MVRNVILKPFVFQQFALRVLASHIKLSSRQLQSSSNSANQTQESLLSSSRRTHTWAAPNMPWKLSRTHPAPRSTWKSTKRLGHQCHGLWLRKCAPWSPDPVGQRTCIRGFFGNWGRKLGCYMRQMFHTPFLLSCWRALEYEYQASTKTEQNPRHGFCK